MSDDINITGIIFSYNNINTIKHCLDSLKKFDRVVVFDSNSTDGTLEYLKKQNIKLITGPRIKGNWLPIKNYIMKNHCNTTHCFHLDTDEIINIDFYDELNDIWEEDRDTFPITVQATVIYKDRCKSERHPCGQPRSGPLDKLRYHNPRNKVHEVIDRRLVPNPRFIVMNHVLIQLKDIERDWCMKNFRMVQDNIRKIPNTKSIYDEYGVETWEELMEYMKTMDTFPLNQLVVEGFILPRKDRLEKFLNIKQGDV